VSQRRTSPSVLAAQAHLRRVLADGPVPCAALRVHDRDRGIYVAARRNERVQVVRVGGEPCYSLPSATSPTRSSS
jgi:hypothetical protein